MWINTSFLKSRKWLILGFRLYFCNVMAYKFVDNYRERGARKKLVEELKLKGISDERVLKAIGNVKDIISSMRLFGIRLIWIRRSLLEKDRQFLTHTQLLIKVNCCISIREIRCLRLVQDVDIKPAS